MNSKVEKKLQRERARARTRRQTARERVREGERERMRERENEKERAALGRESTSALLGFSEHECFIRILSSRFSSRFSLSRRQREERKKERKKERMRPGAQQRFSYFLLLISVLFLSGSCWEDERETSTWRAATIFVCSILKSFFLSCSFLGRQKREFDIARSDDFLIFCFFLFSLSCCLFGKTKERMRPGAQQRFSERWRGFCALGHTRRTRLQFCFCCRYQTQE